MLDTHIKNKIIQKMIFSNNSKIILPNFYKTTKWINKVSTISNTKTDANILHGKTPLDHTILC